MTTEVSQQVKQGKRVSKKIQKPLDNKHEHKHEEPVQHHQEEPVTNNEELEKPSENSEEVPVSEDDLSVEIQINVLRDAISNSVKQIKEHLNNFKTIDHELKKLSITAKKFMKKKEKKSMTKRNINNGFNALVKISDELANFLNLPHGSEIRPPQVSSLISKYAIEHNLKDPKNKAVYLCDKKMLKLLGPAKFPIKKSEPHLGLGVSIFNLNSYLKPHFIKI